MRLDAGAPRSTGSAHRSRDLSARALSVNHRRGCSERLSALPEPRSVQGVAFSPVELPRVQRFFAVPRGHSGDRWNFRASRHDCHVFRIANQLATNAHGSLPDSVQLSAARIVPAAGQRDGRCFGFFNRHFGNPLEILTLLKKISTFREPR